MSGSAPHKVKAAFQLQYRDDDGWWNITKHAVPEHNFVQTEELRWQIKKFAMTFSRDSESTCRTLIDRVTGLILDSLVR